MTDFKDLTYLEMAYGLAEKARGWASPNPLVGAVVVRGGKVIGSGFHERPGKAHAEVIALEQAGRLARGSTLYVTLEPCVHWGRTPPCADAVIRAAPRRVVVSSLDPNPLVYKKGVEKLRRAGIHVSVGLLEERNRTLNESYIKYITRGLPFVTLKAAMSLDGRIATRTRQSRWISSAEARDYAHLLRGEHDAIMVGIQTVLRDDPLLTVRHPLWKDKKIARVVLDSALAFPLQARMLKTLEKGNVTVFTTSSVSPRKRNALEKTGVEVIAIPRRRGTVRVKNALSLLGKKGISSILVEGGSRLLTTMIEEKLADKLFLIFSPRLIGGLKAPSFFEGQGARTVLESWPVRLSSVFTVGRELICEGYF